MATTEQKVSYFNTLIFTVITAIVSLGVLSLLFTESGKKMIYFIIAFEVGVFLIILYCIYKIISGETKSSSKSSTYVVNFDQCPDYYTKYTHTNGDSLCLNNYIVKDDKGNIYVIRLDGNLETDTMDQTITLNPPGNTPLNTIAEFELTKLQKDTLIKNYEDKCALVMAKPPSSDTKYNSYAFYNKLPWTYLKSRCEGLAS